jgi:MFS transporter, DHA1 family, multidrug resistance protein
MSKKLMQSLVIGAGFPLTQLAILLYTPILPLLAKVFHVDPSVILTTPSVVLVGYLIGHLVWGTGSDYIGRRPALLIGLCVFILSAVFAGLSTQLSFFWIFSGVMGFSAATFTSVGNAFMVDIYGKQKAVKAIAYIGIAMATTPVIVPILGVALYKGFGWQSIYYFIAAYAFIMLLFVLGSVPRKLCVKEVLPTHGLLKGYRLHLSNKAFIKNVLVLALIFGVFVTSIAMLPYVYLHYLNVSKAQFSILGLCIILPSPFLATLAKNRVEKLGTRKLIQISTYLSLTGAFMLVILFSLHSHIITLISIALLLVFSSVGIGLSMCKAATMASVQNNVGAASSLMKFIQTGGAVILSGINAHFYHHGGMISFAVILFVSSILLVFAARRPCR